MVESIGLVEISSAYGLNPEDHPNFCKVYAKRTPAIPYHNGTDECLGCHKPIHWLTSVVYLESWNASLARVESLGRFFNVDPLDVIAAIPDSYRPALHDKREHSATVRVTNMRLAQ